MLDLDQIKRDWTDGEFEDELDAVRSAQRTIPALIAELRASRKVVEAARELEAQLRRGVEPIHPSVALERSRLIGALAELSSINDVITEGK